MVGGDWEMKVEYCDKCKLEFKSTDNSYGFIRFGKRELEDKSLCDNCILLFEQHIRLFFEVIK